MKLCHDSLLTPHDPLGSIPVVWSVLPPHCQWAEHGTKIVRTVVLANSCAVLAYSGTDSLLFLYRITERYEFSARKDMNFYVETTKPRLQVLRFCSNTRNSAESP